MYVCVYVSACVQVQSTIMLENPQLTCITCSKSVHACVHACVRTVFVLNVKEGMFGNRKYNISSSRRYQLPSLLSATETIL